MHYAFTHRLRRLSLKYVAEAGSLAEEVISTVRTAQAFGTQSVLADLYDKYIVRTRKVDMSAAIWHGGGLASFFFVIYASYALGTFVTVKFRRSILNLFYSIQFRQYTHYSRPWWVQSTLPPMFQLTRSQLMPATLSTSSSPSSSVHSLSPCLRQKCKVCIHHELR